MEDYGEPAPWVLSRRGWRRCDGEKGRGPPPAPGRGAPPAEVEARRPRSAQRGSRPSDDKLRVLCRLCGSNRHEPAGRARHEDPPSPRESRSSTTSRAALTGASQRLFARPATRNVRRFGISSIEPLRAPRTRSTDTRSRRDVLCGLRGLRGWMGWRGPRIQDPGVTGCASRSRFASGRPGRPTSAASRGTPTPAPRRSPSARWSSRSRVRPRCSPSRAPRAPGRSAWPPSCGRGRGGRGRRGWWSR